MGAVSNYNAMNPNPWASLNNYGVLSPPTPQPMYGLPGLGTDGADWLATSGGMPAGSSPLATGVAPNIPGAVNGMNGLGGMGGNGGIFGIKGFGMDEAKLALGGLQTIGQLWGAIQSAKMANKQFNFTKDITETNLANQIRSYNTSLEDRGRSRAVVEGQSAAQTQDYYDRNKAVRR